MNIFAYSVIFNGVGKPRTATYSNTQKDHQIKEIRRSEYETKCLNCHDTQQQRRIIVVSAC